MANQSCNTTLRDITKIKEIEMLEKVNKNSEADKNLLGLKLENVNE